MPEGYIIEFVRVGAVVKVTACDPETGLEVSLQAPAGADEHGLSRLAIQKLRYRLERPHD